MNESDANGSDPDYLVESQDAANTGHTGVDSGPRVVLPDNLEVSKDNPNIVRALPRKQVLASPQEPLGSYPDIVEGSDSERTGTSWGLPALEDAQTDSSSEQTTHGE